MLKSRHNLLEGDIAPQLRGLAFPLMWGFLAMHAFGFIDTYYLSKLGTDVLAAMGFTIPVVMTFMGFLFGMSVGTSSAVARTFGEGNLEKVRRLSTDSITLVLVVSISATLVGHVLMTPVFRSMGAPEALMPMIRQFMTAWHVAFILVGVLMMGNSCMRAQGDTRYASFMMILFVSINIIIDPFLIFGWGPFPALGLTGSAVTQAIGYAITLAVSFYFLGIKKKMLSGHIFHRDTFSSWKKIMHVAFPATLSNIIPALSAAVITWIIADHGKEAVAAIGVSARIENLVLATFYCFSGAVAIFSGQNFGAGNFGRVRHVCAIATRYCLIWGLVVAAILYYAAPFLAAFFDGNENVIRYTTLYMHVVPVSYGALGVMFLTHATMNAIGKPVAATLLLLMRAVIIYIPLAFMAEKYFGFVGIITALAFTNFVLAFASWVWNEKLIP